MTLYQCPKCNLKKDVAHCSLEIIDGKIVCKCGKEMESTEEDNGMPNIIRNESSMGKGMLKRMKRK